MISRRKIQHNSHYEVTQQSSLIQPRRANFRVEFGAVDLFGGTRSIGTTFGVIRTRNPFLRMQVL